MTDRYNTDETITEQQREVQQMLQSMREFERQRAGAADAADAEPIASVQKTAELQ
ncbi:hypothetical protein [Paenibacillus alkalitolerans]|uniref:hypothetical protein n=1 Tax=Paenibacillus alkalitolerans TaxID=2799335 RepID=UPI0018F58939|nr:hypothetical protein [Paenibacillus alkalitolerans]